jgi:uncharacterized membrane protein
MHADRTNRFVLALVGFIALVLGVGGLLAAAGVFGTRVQHQHLLDNRLSRYFSDHGDWLWPAIAGVVFVLVLLVLVWLLHLLFSTDRTGDIALDTAQDAGPRGRTEIQSSAVTRAVTSEIESYHGVTGARARIIGERRNATLVIEVAASRRADLPELLHRIETEAVQNVRGALGEPEFPVTLDLTVNDKTVARAN